MTRRSFLFVLVCLPFLGSTALSAETTRQALPIVRILEARYRNIKTLKAAFLQTYRDGRSGIQVESGTAYFSRPGRMRWEYESPETKLFVVDGKTVWFFVPADRTVTRSAMKDSDDWRTPLAFLTGKATLSQLCERVDVSGTSTGQSGHAVLSCVPRGTKLPKSVVSDTAGASEEGILTPASYDRVLLEVDTSTGELADVRVLQQGGIEIEFRFGQWEHGLSLEATMFRFQAPPGVTVLDEPAER